MENVQRIWRRPRNLISICRNISNFTFTKRNHLFPKCLIWFPLWPQYRSLNAPLGERSRGLWEQQDPRQEPPGTPLWSCRGFHRRWPWTSCRSGILWHTRNRCRSPGKQHRAACYWTDRNVGPAWCSGLGNDWCLTFMHVLYREMNEVNRSK